MPARGRSTHGPVMTVILRVGPPSRPSGRIPCAGQSCDQMQPRSEMKDVDLGVEETEASLKAVSVETVEVDERMGRGR